MNSDKLSVIDIDTAIHVAQKRAQGLANLSGGVDAATGAVYSADFASLAQTLERVKLVLFGTPADGTVQLVNTVVTDTMRAKAVISGIASSRGDWPETRTEGQARDLEKMAQSVAWHTAYDIGQAVNWGIGETVPACPSTDK